MNETPIPVLTRVEPAAPRPSALGRAGQFLPTLLVLAALGALAFVGHQAGWKVPKFSALLGNGGPTENEWCDEHGVPEAECVECNAALMPKPRSFGWCKTHGVHECPYEHPEVAQLPVKPKVTQADLERAKRGLDFAERPANNPKCQLHTRRVQFASPEAMNRQGIELDAVWQTRIEETVAATGEITYDPTRVAALTTPVPGKVWRVEKQIGQPVHKDDVLALVDAADVGKAKAEFLQAVAQLDLRSKMLEVMRPAFLQGVIPEARFREAESAVHEAQIRLAGAQQALVNLGLPVRGEEFKSLDPHTIGRRIQFLGLPESIVKTLDPETTTANLIPVKAPLDGLVVARKAVAGEMVDLSKTLFTVADPRHMWLTLHVRLEDTNYLAPGQTVRFRPDGGRETVAGKVEWISTAADDKTRTVEVRASLDNTAGRLRANTFGAGTIVLREEAQAIVVANEAVHWDGNCHVVFVYDKNSPPFGAPKVFHARSVRVGAKDDTNTEIIAGLVPKEMVAVKNSGVLRAQLLRSNLGAG